MGNSQEWGGAWIILPVGNETTNFFDQSNNRGNNYAEWFHGERNKVVANASDTYFLRLWFSATVAADPGKADGVVMSEGVMVSEQVATLISDLHCRNAKTVMTDGRRPSSWSSSTGSNTECVPAAQWAHIMTKFMVEWRVISATLYRHDKGWRPSDSITAPQRHGCCWQIWRPSPIPTPIDRESSSRPFPICPYEIALSKSLLCGWNAAQCERVAYVNA